MWLHPTAAVALRGSQSRKFQPEASRTSLINQADEPVLRLAEHTMWEGIWITDCHVSSGNSHPTSGHFGQDLPRMVQRAAEEETSQPLKLMGVMGFCPS